MSAIALIGLAAAYLVTAFLPSQEPSASQEARSAVRAARRALTAGDIESAVRWTDHAARICSKPGAGMKGSELRQIIDLHRQVSVVGDLSESPLEALLHEAARLPPEEWEARLTRLHRGSGIILEASLVKGEREDELLAGYEITASQERGRLVLPSDSGELEASPLPILFGARLRDVRLEAGTTATAPCWNFTITPRTFVRLTDPDLVKLLNQRADRRDWPTAQSPLDSEHVLPGLSIEAIQRLEPPTMIQRQFTKQALIEQWTYANESRDRLTFIRRAAGRQ